MKQKWNEPKISTLEIINTMEDEQIRRLTPRDLGHGYDDIHHSHHCTCGLYFGTWGAAQAHEKEMTLSGQSRYHNVGCDLIS